MQHVSARRLGGDTGCLKWAPSFCWDRGAGVGIYCSSLVNGADEATKTIDQQEADKLKDAKITSCTADEAGFMAAKVEITNHSSDRSNYDVTVAYTSPDGTEQYDTGDAVVQALEAGQKITETATNAH